MTKLFETGEPQDITAVLESKDARVAFQKKLVTDYPDDSILAVKLNIPGPIKNNDQLHRGFNHGLLSLIQLLQATNAAVKLVAQWDKPTGNEAFLTVSGALETAKRQAVAFEDQDAFGRLFDVDVFGHGQSTALSRTKLGLPVRKCFICGRPAKACARSRRHSISELQVKISQVFDQEFKGEAGVVNDD